MRRARFHLLSTALIATAVVSGTASARDVDPYAPASRSITIHRRHHAYSPAPPVAVGSPVVIPLGPAGVVVQTPFVEVAGPGLPDQVVRLPHYQKPDGSYDGLYGLSATIQGYPCGQECTNRALENWGYAPVY